jgi:Flp pilus assembly protein TadG
MRATTTLMVANGRNKGARRSGAAAAELAVTLPFVVFLFVAAVDFSRVYFYTQTLENCAMTGALYASGTAPIASSAQTLEDAAKTAACAEGTSLNPPLQPQQVSVSSDATTVTVTVNYDYAMLTPLLTQSGVIPLVRAVTMNKAPTPWK